MATEHITVLLNEAVDALVGDPDGVYIDGTFGRGGHSRLILERLSQKGRLIGVDKDPQAIEAGLQLSSEDGRFQIQHGSFADVESIAAGLGLEKVAGILVDLGVSSPQLDLPERGFSFLNDGPLDMRMDTSSGESAADWINRADEQDIARVLKEFGEERFAKRIARAITESRLERPFTRTSELASVVSEANPAWEKHKHPATRAFQAIRIFINNELGDLDGLLDSSLRLLQAKGRLVAISFHSLEDRMIKRFIRDQQRGENLPKGLPMRDDQLNKTMKAIGKAVKASGAEVEVNPRSRSAVMRVAERL